jgi:hypothetical protein
MLMGIELEHNGPCPRLGLYYGDIESSAATSDWLNFQVLPAACAPPNAAEGTLRAGPFTGSEHTTNEGRDGLLSDGRTAIDYTGNLPTDDTLRLFETLEPYDPATRPTVLTAP